MKRKVAITLDRKLLRNIDREALSVGLKRSSYINMMLKRRRRI